MNVLPATITASTPPVRRDDAPDPRERTGEVLQLLIVDHHDDVRRWIDTLIDTVSRNDGFLGGRSLTSADGGRTVVGLRWRDVDAMATAAVTSAPLRRPAAPDGEPIVLIFDHDSTIGAAHVRTNELDAPPWSP